MAGGITVTAGRDAYAWSRGVMWGDVQAGFAASIVSYDNQVTNIVAGTHAEVISLGKLDVDVQAGGNSYLFSVGNMTGKVDSGGTLQLNSCNPVRHGTCARGISFNFLLRWRC